MNNDAYIQELNDRAEYHRKLAEKYEMMKLEALKESEKTGGENKNAGDGIVEESVRTDEYVEVFTIEGRVEPCRGSDFEVIWYDPLTNITHVGRKKKV